MSKCKRILSGFLMIVMVFTAIWSSGTIAHASMLPLKEEKAYLILNSNDNLQALSVDDILDRLQHSDGTYAKENIPNDATTVWQYIKDDEDGLEVYKEYKIGENETIDLSEYSDTAEFKLELIVGSHNQLDKNNVRFIITVCLLYYNEMSFDVYTQSALNNERTEVKPIKKTYTDGYYDKISDKYGNPIPLNNFSYIIPVGDYENVYIGLNASIAQRPDVRVELYELEDNKLQNPITDQVLDQDMTQKNAGYKINQKIDGGMGASFIMVYYINGVQADVSVVTLILSGGYVHVEGNLYSGNGDDKQSVVYNESESIDIDDDIYTIEYVLKNGNPVDGEYYLNFEVKNGDQDLSENIIKVVPGHYDSLQDASSVEDVKNQLFSTSNGYKSTFDENGQKFTLFFKDGTVSGSNVYKIIVKAVEYEKNWSKFTEKPIIGEADPWLRVTGATDSDGNEYDTYVVENGKNINMDTYYGYGYQTIFINDANADLTALKPTFWYANTDRVYAVSKDSGNRVDENHIRDFSEENQQYTGVIFDNNKENERNYWVTFKKLNNNGPELYVYGPSEREVILDEYFEFKHDILIANIGNAPLEDISVELVDAENVKLDEYWTVGGDGNDTLAPFTSTSTDTQYGELDNLAKIRLLPDGDGEVKGTLIIRAKGQDPVMITLNGTAQNPEIVTETMADAVKYVPYQQIVATNNMHDWVDTQFSISEGSLPDGVELNSDTGEIYGVPTVAETDKETTYSFTVKAEYLVEGEAGYFDPSYKDYQLTVKPNTDENVYLASDSDEGYSIKQPIGTQTGEYSFELEEIADTVFTSNGEYDEFVGLWLNGELLQPGTDYDSEPGSTKLTIRSQTFDDYADKDGINTIAMEFRKDTDGDGKGDKGAEMNRTAQNFTVKKETSKPSQSEIDHAAANRVISLIGSIPSSVTLNDKGTINKARTAYNALTDSQQKLVTNYSRLTRAEAAIKQLEKNAKDKAAADKVVSMINALPDWIKLDNKGEVNAARNAYNMLTASQKGYVSNYGKLQEAEAVIAKLEKETGKTESVTFVGILVDKNDNAYADRFVELHSDVQNGRTDENGSFQFNDVEFGKHTIYVKNTNGDTVAKKEFYIRSGSPLSVSDDGIIAENGSVFTVKIQLDGDELTFLNIEEGNKAPTVTLREDVNSIDIGDDGKLSESGSPQTGENADLTVWYILLAVSLSVLVFTGYIKIKKRRYERHC